MTLLCPQQGEHVDSVAMGCMLGAHTTDSGHTDLDPLDASACHTPESSVQQAIWAAGTLFSRWSFRRAKLFMQKSGTRESHPAFSQESPALCPHKQEPWLESKDTTTLGQEGDEVQREVEIHPQGLPLRDLGDLPPSCG